MCYLSIYGFRRDEPSEGQSWDGGKIADFEDLRKRIARKFVNESFFISKKLLAPYTFGIYNYAGSTL